MWFEIKCGCKVDVDVYTASGCCCGDCYRSYDTEIESVEFVSTCDEHTAN